MKTQVSVEASKTRAYQKYTVGLVYDFEHENDEELAVEISRSQAVCRKAVVEQIRLDTP